MAHVVAPQPILVRHERGARLGQLQRPDDPATVIGMDSGRRLGIPLGERLVRRFGPELVVGALPARPLLGRRGGRKGELDEGRPKIQARATDNDRRQALLECVVDRRVRELGVLADRYLVLEPPDRDQLGRVLGLVRENRDSAVDLHRIGGDQPRRYAFRHRLGDGALARRGRAKDRDDVSH